MFRNHLCIVFEELNKNLYEVLKQQNYYGLSTKLNCIYLLQILDCLSLLSKARVIHCDLKPEVFYNHLIQNIIILFDLLVINYIIMPSFKFIYYQ